VGIQGAASCGGRPSRLVSPIQPYEPAGPTQLSARGHFEGERGQASVSQSAICASSPAPRRRCRSLTGCTAARTARRHRPRRCEPCRRPHGWILLSGPSGYFYLATELPTRATTGDTTDPCRCLPRCCRRSSYADECAAHRFQRRDLAPPIGRGSSPNHARLKDELLGAQEGAPKFCASLRLLAQERGFTSAGWHDRNHTNGLRVSPFTAPVLRSVP
jgi:hypothetical protein